MTNKITRSMLSDKPVIKIGYCAAQSLLSLSNRIGYMAGVYGWNCDVYEFNQAYMITGYRFAVKGIDVDYATVYIFEKYAEMYKWNNRGAGYQDKKNHLENKINDFITGILAGIRA